MDSKFLKGKKYIDLTSYFNKNNISENDLKIDSENKIEYNDEIYYLKEIKTDLNTLYCELIAVKLLDKLNIPHVKYYLADFFGKSCLMSESFKKEGNSYISGEKILEDYRNAIKKKYQLSDMNNLETIWNALSYRYNSIYGKGNYIKDVAKLMNQLTTVISFDIVTDNEDRYYSNWVVEEGINHISLSKMFDNEYMLNSYLDDESLNSFALGIYPEDTEHFINYVDVIKKYIRDSSSEFINKLIMVYNTLSIDVFLQCIKEVEDEFQFIIPSENRQLIINSYKKHYELLGQILNDYQLHPSRLI